MALRPLDFNVPPPRPSPIEEAFAQAIGTTIATFLTTPVRRKLAREQQAGELASATALEGLRLQSLPEELRLRGNAAVNQARGLGEVAIDQTVPAAKAAARARVASLDVLRGANVEPGTQSIINQIRSLGRLPTDTPTTLAELEQTGPLLGELVQSENIREFSRQRVQARVFQDQARLASLLNNTKIEDWVGRGVRNPDGTTRPLTPDEVLGLANPELRTFETTPDESIRATTRTLTEAATRVNAAGGWVRLPGITRGELEAEVLRLQSAGAENHSSLRAYAGLAMQYGFNKRSVGGKLETIGEIADVQTELLGGLKPALRALILKVVYRDMQAVIDAERHGFELPDAETLGYLERIYAVEAQQNPSIRWRVENRNLIREPSGLLPIQPSRAPGQVVPDASKGTGIPAPTLGGAGVTHALPINELPPGVDPFIYTASFEAIKNRPGAADSVYAMILDAYSTPETAIAFLRQAGVSDAELGRILFGTDRQKELALSRMKGDALTSFFLGRDAALRR